MLADGGLPVRVPMTDGCQAGVADIHTRIDRIAHFLSIICDMTDLQILAFLLLSSPNPRHICWLTSGKEIFRVDDGIAENKVTSIKPEHFD